MRGVVRVLLIAGIVSSWSAVVRADDVGEFGTPVGLQVNTTSADTYLQYHGRLFVKAANGTLDEYRWGGTSCGSRVLNDAQIAALQGAIDNNKIRIELLTQDGQGSAVCVVGFTLAPKSALKLGIP
jgi:hypothetical protein